MDQTRVLLLHGFQHHREQDHWLWWIAEELRRRSIPVQYPQLPNPDHPQPSEWISVATAELAMLGDGDRVVVTHSLGGVLWSHLVQRGLTANERVLMVAPPSRDRLDGVIAAFAGALGPDYLDTNGVTLVARERDRYRNTPLNWLDGGRAKEIHVLPGEGHLNADDGHGPFPEALEWVLRGVWPASATTP
jgi:predicted alpha/beta hydrolase family esterase